MNEFDLLDQLEADIRAEKIEFAKNSLGRALVGCVVCLAVLVAQGILWWTSGVLDVVALLVLAIPTNLFVGAVLYYRWKLRDLTARP